MKAQGNMKEEDFMLILNDADDEGKVELLRLLVKLDEEIPPAVLEGYKEIGMGCYLTCDELNQGTLYTHWSKSNALSTHPQAYLHTLGHSYKHLPSPSPATSHST